MKTLNDFQRTQLPPITDFYNDLSEEPLSPDVYDHAQKVWREFKIQNMGEWHDLYVRLDAALLADVVENTRKIMMESYGNDLAHYFSLPQMAWDAVLKISGVQLELIKDPTMHCWVESAIRGGMKLCLFRLFW